MVTPTAGGNSTDDLKKIEGIGPVLEKHLHSNGIKTYADVANSDPKQLKSVLDLEGERFRVHQTDTRPQQALLCHEGKWDALKQWQDDLKWGKVA